MKAELCERTFSLGKARYKVNAADTWQCLLWGWFPNNNGTPTYRWAYIPKEKVPKEILKLAS